MTTQSPDDGAQPRTENDGASASAQPQNASTDMDSYSADELLAAITGDSPAPQNPNADPVNVSGYETQPTTEGAQPQEDGADHKQGGKSEAIRLRLSALPPEQQQETAEAYRLVREGKAVDLPEAFNQLRGTNQQANTPADNDAEQETVTAAETKPSTVTELELQIDDARASLREAREMFDAEKEEELEIEVQNLMRKLAKEELKAELQQQQSSEAEQRFQSEYNAAVEELESQFPDVLDDDSEFTQLLDEKLSAARYRKDPGLSDPRFILALAAQVDNLLSKPSGRKPSPPPAIPRPNGAQVAPIHNQAPRPSEDQMRSAINEASPEELLASIARM